MIYCSQSTREDALIKCRLAVILAQREFENRSPYTITDLAEASGVHRDTISRWARHKAYRFDGHVLDALCRVLDVGVGDILVYVPDGKEEG